MNQEARKLTPRERVLVGAVRRLREYDENFGDPQTVSACAGELQRVLLKYALRSGRPMSVAEHSALDEALRQVARIACGPVIYEGSYLEAGAFLAVAGECALANTGEMPDVDGGSEEEIAKALAEGLDVSQLEHKDSE